MAITYDRLPKEIRYQIEDSNAIAWANAQLKEYVAQLEEDVGQLEHTLAYSDSQRTRQGTVISCLVVMVLALGGLLIWGLLLLTKCS